MTTTEDQPAAPGPGASDSGSADAEDRIPFGLNPRHFGIDPDEPWPDDVPKDQDDTWWRFMDDPKRARRSELKIAFCFGLTMLGSIALAAVFVAGGQTQVEGIAWGVAFLGLGVGFVLWARDLAPGNEVIASRGHHDVCAQADRVAVTESLARGVEPMARRPFLAKTLALVGGVFGLATLFPLASLGPRPGKDLYYTKWGPGVRAVTQDGTPIRPEDLSVGGIMTVFPEGNLDDALSPTLLLNVGSAPLKVPAGKENWTVGNRVVAFSKICTHAGCPAGLYNVQQQQLICPCHQSTFDVLEDCKPVFGPASRSLPQLPLAQDQNGYIVAQSDYHEPVGPGFWNRA